MKDITVEVYQEGSEIVIDSASAVHTAQFTNRAGQITVETTQLGMYNVSRPAVSYTGELARFELQSPGPQGPPGEATAGTTVTLPPGEDAWVDDSRGTPHKAVFDFGIPQGVPGPPGITTLGILDDLLDVDVMGITNGQTIAYDVTKNMYVPGGQVKGEEVHVGTATPLVLTDVWIDIDEPDPALYLRYTHTQAVPAKVWNVVHSLGCHPSITVEDGAGTIIQGTITYVSNDVLTVGFAFALTGKVNCI